jgi:cytidylate kinase
MRTYLKFLYPYERELEKKLRKKGLTITVSGLTGSGKTTGAEAIAEALNLKYYEAGSIQKSLAKKKKISLEEQVKTRNKEVDYHIDKKTLEFAISGNCVLVGRLTGWVAGKWADVRIFYDTPFEVRAKRVAKREGISVEEAKKKVKLRDLEDRKKYKKIYGIDLKDKSIYDIVFDNSKVSLERSKKLIVKIVKEFLKRRKIVIAISGLPGAGSTTIARKLAKKLKLKYFSPGEIFKSCARGKEVEAAIKVWKSRGKSKKFHQMLDDLQKKLAKKGNCVVCGKLSVWVLKDLSNCRIWVEAPLSVRAKRVARRDKLPVEIAKKLLKEREKIERVEWKRIYGIDYFEQKKSTDLVINTSKLTPSQVVEKILKFVGKKF